MNTPTTEARIKRAKDELQAAIARRGTVVTDLGRKRLNKEDTTEVLERLDAANKEVTALQAERDELIAREREAREAQAQEAAQIKRTVIASLTADIRQEVLAMSEAIALLKDRGIRLGTVLNAGQSLDDPLLQFQCNKLRLSLRPYLLHAVAGYPGCNTGLSPFLKLDETTYGDLAPAVDVEKK